MAWRWALRAAAFWPRGGSNMHFGLSAKDLDAFSVLDPSTCGLRALTVAVDGSIPSSTGIEALASTLSLCATYPVGVANALLQAVPGQGPD
eukprot:3804958-Alexandrium_andersonii.AAC.1